MPITGFQIRAARSLIGMEQVTLAVMAGVSANTIRNMEAFGMQRVKVRTDTLDAVTDALRRSGVMFLDEGQSAGGGSGVRLDHTPPMLFRRDDVPEHSWVAFAFDVSEKRHVGFAHYDALKREQTDDPIKAFDSQVVSILRKAVMKLEEHDLDEKGHVHIQGPGALR